MAIDKAGKTIKTNDDIVLRMTVIEVHDPEPDAHENAQSIVTAVLDPKDPLSPRFCFRADQVEKLS
ncbi:MAG: hypothetical protein ABFD89_09935 [Bryobacteraceae bacterium]